MPSGRTGFEKRAEEYLDAISAVVGIKNLGPGYMLFIERLNGVMLEIKGAATEHTKIDEEIQNRLLVEYQELIDSANVFLSKTNMSFLEKRVATIVTDIRNLAVEDVRSIGNIKADGTLEFREIVAAGQKVTLDISGQPINTVGGVMSKRIPLEYTDGQGRIVKGFFTESSKTVDPLWLIGATFRPLMEKYPETLAFAREVASYYKTMPDMTIEFIPLQNGIQALKEGKIEEAKEMIGHFCGGLMMPEEVKQMIVGSFDQHPDFAKDFVEALDQFPEKMAAANNMCSTSLGIGATPGRSVEERNCAMTSVANLLGMGDILAASHMVTMIKDGKVTRGCLMEMAKGEDRAHLHQDDAIATWSVNAQQQGAEPAVTPQAMKQILDMQVLDYICGNADRHESNVYYQFDTTDPAHPILTGVQGIDNDLSFGTNPFNSRVLRGVHPRDMGVIASSTAETILTMPPEALEMTLEQYDLSPEEKQAALDRLSTLQEMIRKEMRIERGLESKIDPNEPRLRIVEDFALTVSAVRELSGNKENHIRRFLSEGPEATARDVSNGYFEPRKELKTTGAVMGRITSQKGVNYREMLNKVSAIYERFAQADRGLHRNSQEYKDLKASMEKLMGLSEMIAKGVSVDKSIIRRAMDQVYDDAYSYISDKPDIPKTEMGRDRLFAARDIRDLMEDYCLDLNDTMVSQPQQAKLSFTEELEARTRAELDTRRNLAMREKQLNPGFSNDGVRFIAESVYIQTVMDEYRKNPSGNVLEKLTPTAITQGGMKLMSNPKSKERAKAWSGANLDVLLADPGFPKKVMEGMVKTIQVIANPPQAAPAEPQAAPVTDPQQPPQQQAPEAPKGPAL